MMTRSERRFSTGRPARALTESAISASVTFASYPSSARSAGLSTLLSAGRMFFPTGQRGFGVEWCKTNRSPDSTARYTSSSRPTRRRRVHRELGGRQSIPDS